MADYAYITSTGVVIPDTADLLGTVQDEFREAFGQDLDVSPETPQGVLITAEVEARDAVARNNAELANQINPNLAGGVFLDAIWQLTGGQRIAATKTIVRNVTLAGVAGTTVNAGSRVSLGAAGAQFELISTVVLDTGGAGVGTFQAVVAGATPVAAEALDTIVSSVLGWESVTNPAAGETGADEETDLAARRRRRQTLAIQGVALPEAITSILYATDGVRSLSFRENATDAAVTIEGVDLSPHSIYACVDGGTDIDVARALLRKKSLGAGWNGGTTVTVTDPFSGQDYAVSFDRPELVPVYVRVTVALNGASYPDAPTVVREAMLAYANGEQDGEVGLAVGSNVSPFELGAAVNREAAPLYVRSVTLSTDGVTYSAAEIPITIAQKAVLTAGGIAVTVVGT